MEMEAVTEPVWKTVLRQQVLDRIVDDPVRRVVKHHGPGPHPGTGSTQQEAHGHGDGKGDGKQARQVADRWAYSEYEEIDAALRSHIEEGTDLPADLAEFHTQIASAPVYEGTLWRGGSTERKPGDEWADAVMSYSASPDLANWFSEGIMYRLRGAPALDLSETYGPSLGGMHLDPGDELLVSGRFKVKRVWKRGDDRMPEEVAERFAAPRVRRHQQRLRQVVDLEWVKDVRKHHGPGPHPGTGSTQQEAHGRGEKAAFTDVASVEDIPVVEGRLYHASDREITDDRLRGWENPDDYVGELMSVGYSEEAAERERWRAEYVFTTETPSVEYGSYVYEIEPIGDPDEWLGPYDDAAGGITVHPERHRITARYWVGEKVRKHPGPGGSERHSTGSTQQEAHGGGNGSLAEQHRGKRTVTLLQGRDVKNWDDVQDYIDARQQGEGGAYAYAFTFDMVQIRRGASPSKIPDHYYETSGKGIYWKGKWQPFSEVAIIREQNRAMGRD
jgi:hypothetical protein